MGIGICGQAMKRYDSAESGRQLLTYEPVHLHVDTSPDHRIERLTGLHDLQHLETGCLLMKCDPILTKVLGGPFFIGQVSIGDDP